MKQKKTILISCVTAIIFIFAFISFHNSRGIASITSEIPELAINAITLSRTVGNTFIENKPNIRNLNEAEKNQSKILFDEKLSTVFEPNSTAYNRLSLAHGAYVDNATTADCTIENNVLAYTVDSISIKNDKANLKLTLTNSQKYIDEMENGKFKSVFPFSNTTINLKLSKSENNWKVTDFNLENHDFAGDVSSEKIFSTFEEANAYSLTVTPQNPLETQSL